MTPDKLATGAGAAFTSNSGTTTSTTLTTTLSGTPGTNPSVTVDIGANGLALVSMYTSMQNSGGANATNLGFQASGANTVAASIDNSVSMISAGPERLAGTLLLTGLTPGSTTFQLAYRVSGGTGTFSDRRLSVVPL